MSRPNPAIETVIKPFDDDAIVQAAGVIRAGGCVAVPTETVYGLAADATNGKAVARIYAAKGRPSFNPLIVHVATIEDAREVAQFDAIAEKLASAFWPGPLTLVLPIASDSPIADLVTAGLDTIAVRIPAHPAMQALLKAGGRPLAAPSANTSGRISPTRAEHVASSLDGRIGLIIDAGPTGHGIESTIVGHDGAGFRLLRPGPIPIENIEAAAGRAVSCTPSDTVTAPGQMASHYAPSKPLRLNATEAEADEWLIGFGPVKGDSSLSDTGDLVEAAARLFACLYEAEASTCSKIAVAPLPETGIGTAIADRLTRAAHRD